MNLLDFVEEVDMRLVELSCPRCGAQLVADFDEKSYSCQFCGAELLLDDGVQRFSYNFDNPEELGYQFERGRRRAEAEYRYSSTGPENTLITCHNCGNANVIVNKDFASTNGIYNTRYYCNDCKYSWVVQSNAPQQQVYPSGFYAPPKKRRTWLWVLGWVFMFPIPLAILFWRNETMSTYAKLGLILIAWIIYYVIIATG